MEADQAFVAIPCGNQEAANHSINLWQTAISLQPQNLAKPLWTQKCVARWQVRLQQRWWYLRLVPQASLG